MHLLLQWSFLLLALGAFFHPGFLTEAYDLRTAKAPQGPLGVTLDFAFANAGPPAPPPGQKQNARNWLFSSHLTFPQPVNEISDAQIVQIAMDAYNEITAVRKQYQLSDKATPGAFSVLAFGNELILSSSQKGPKSFTYDFGPSPVLTSLKLCSAVFQDAGPPNANGDQNHRTEGKCGEVLAAHMYYRSHPGSDTSLISQDARVVTIGPTTDNPPVLAIKPPCGPANLDTWGCSLFVADQNLAVIDENTSPASYDLSSLAGGNPTIGQIQVCE